MAAASRFNSGPRTARVTSARPDSGSNKCWRPRGSRVIGQGQASAVVEFLAARRNVSCR